MDWLFTDKDYGYNRFYASIGSVLMGRKTYEQVIAFGNYPYAGKQGYVFSRTLSRAVHPDAEIIAEDSVPFCRQLKSISAKDIWLVGGSEMVRLLMDQQLIDRFVLSVHPCILGEGIPLFREPCMKTRLQFHKSKTYPSGLVQLAYIRAK